MANNIPDGFAFVAGRGREKAIALLAAADAVKVDQTLVRTVSDGFVVPVKIADEYEKTLAAEQEPEEKAPAKTAAKKTTARKKSTSD